MSGYDRPLGARRSTKKLLRQTTEFTGLFRGAHLRVQRRRHAADGGSQR